MYEGFSRCHNSQSVMEGFAVFSPFLSSSYVNQPEVVSCTEYGTVMFLDSKWVPLETFVETDDARKKLYVMSEYSIFYLLD